jgi:hypothetical protein
MPVTKAPSIWSGLDAHINIPPCKAISNINPLMTPLKPTVVLSANESGYLRKMNVETPKSHINADTSVEKAIPVADR